MTNPETPIRSFTINHLLAILCWVYAGVEIWRPTGHKLNWLADALMGVGFAILSRAEAGSIKITWRSSAGRSGTVILILAWILIGVGHVFSY